MHTKQTGSTLLELLIILSIIGVLMLAGNVSLYSAMEYYRQNASINSFKSALNFARTSVNLTNSTYWLCAANKNMDDCAEKNAEFYYATWLVKDINTDKIIYKSAPSKFVFFKTNTPKHAIVINPYHGNSRNTTLLICTGFTKITPKAFSISNTANFRFVEQGASYKKLVKQCNNLN